MTSFFLLKLIHALRRFGCLVPAAIEPITASRFDVVPNQIIVWTKGSLRPVALNPKTPHCTMTLRRQTHIVGLIPNVPGHKTHRLSRPKSDHSFGLPFVVLNTREAAMLDDSTPIDTQCGAKTQCTGTQNSQVVAPMCSKTHSVCTGKLVESRNNKTGCSSKPHANQSKYRLMSAMPRSRKWTAPFADLPEILTPEISGEGTKQLVLSELPVTTKQAHNSGLRAKQLSSVWTLGKASATSLARKLPRSSCY